MKKVIGIMLAVVLLASAGCICPRSLPVSDDVCWLAEGTICVDDVHLVVRTVNLFGTKRSEGDNPDSYHSMPRATIGIAEKFHDDWPHEIGVIGTQETKRVMNSCPCLGGIVHGAECLAEQLSEEYNGELYRYAYYQRLSVIVGKNWRIVSFDGWKIGEDDILAWSKSSRYLLEAKLESRGSPKRVLRFYTTHLSHRADNSRNRGKQIDNIIFLIRDRQRPNELPPIIVGDFNFRIGHESSNYLKLAKHFYFMNLEAAHCSDSSSWDYGIDHIWVGKRSTFSNSKGTYIPLRYHKTPGYNTGIRLRSNYSVQGRSKKLSDHDSPGMSFQIIEGESPDKSVLGYY